MFGRSFVVRKFTLSLKDESKRVEVGMDAVADVSYTCGSLRALMRE
jgi:hypothetical protein